MTAYLTTVFLTDGTSVQADEVVFQSVGTSPINAVQVVICRNAVDPTKKRQFQTFLMLPLANVLGVSSDHLGNEALQ